MAVAPITSTLPALPTLAVGPATMTPTAADTGAFGNMVVGALEDLDQAHSASAALTETAAAGGNVDVADLMIAATEASLRTELTVAVRDKAVDAFNSIMQMPV